MNLQKINYQSLNGKQKERYNFQKISSLLADYGYMCIKLDDDWGNADFIAQHIDGINFLKIQLKSRLTFDKKYQNKQIFIVFPHGEDWFIYDHDTLLEIFLDKYNDKMAVSKSWNRGGYSWGKLSRDMMQILINYKI